MGLVRDWPPAETPAPPGRRLGWPPIEVITYRPRRHILERVFLGAFAFGFAFGAFAATAAWLVVR